MPAATGLQSGPTERRVTTAALRADKGCRGPETFIPQKNPPALSGALWESVHPEFKVASSNPGRVVSKTGTQRLPVPPHMKGLEVGFKPPTECGCVTAPSGEGGKCGGQTSHTELTGHFYQRDSAARKMRTEPSLSVQSHTIHCCTHVHTHTSTHGGHTHTR